MSTRRDRIAQRSQQIAQNGKQLASNGVRAIGDGIHDLKRNPKIQEGASVVTSTVTSSVRRVGDRLNEIKSNPRLQEGASVVSGTVTSSVRVVGDRLNVITSHPKVREGATTVWGVVQEIKASEGAKIVNERVTRLGTTLQSATSSKLAEDQKLARTMERMNRDIQMEEDALVMMREAEQACLQAITNHLIEFVANSPESVTYEEWIADLHPENTHDGKLLEGLGKEVDHRFYVRDSDHRKLWNAYLGGGRIAVPARVTRTSSSATSSIDLLDLSYANLERSIETEKEERPFHEQEEQEQAQAIALKKEAQDRCIQTMEDHFVQFAANRPNASYEQWIADLHPENTRKGQLFRGTLDHRFYLEGSDHRQLWNAHLGSGRHHVPALSAEQFLGRTSSNRWSFDRKNKPWSKKQEVDDLISFEDDDVSI